MGKNDKAVRIVIGGKEWYYQSFYTDENKYECVRVYGDDGEFVKELPDLDSAIAWIRGETEKNQRLAKEKIQREFMIRFSKLKGEMTDADFGVFLEMPGSTVYQYLVGRRFPSVSAMSQIADKCGVTVDWLIGRDGEEDGV